MKIWKVIFAALVIFSAGVVTGILTVKFKTLPTPPLWRGPQFPAAARPRGDYVDRLQKKLELTPPQRAKIEQIWRESGERTKQIWDSARDEHRQVKASIRGELTTEQQKRFDEEFKPRDFHKQPEQRPRDPRRSKSLF